MRTVLIRPVDTKILEVPRLGAGASRRQECGSHILFGRAMKPKRTILCVDDNEQSLSIRKVMLETRGYRVVACNSGLDALEQFKQGGIDAENGPFRLHGPSEDAMGAAPRAETCTSAEAELPEFLSTGRKEQSASYGQARAL